MAGSRKSLVQGFLRLTGLHPLAHRPPLGARFWFYSVAAYLLPVVAVVALPEEGTILDELVWFVTLVPAFLLSLHYGLRGAFLALLLGIGLILGVQLFLTLSAGTGAPGLTIPILIAYGALAISVGWLSEELHDHYEYALELQATQRAEALGSMTAGIAHDFNNILTAMVANAELIAEDAGADGEGVEEELGQLRSAAQRGAGIVRNLLGFSRRGMLNRRPVDLAKLVEEHLQMLRRLFPESVEVRVHAEPDLPPVLADRGAVEAILGNLMANARDAMTDPGVVEVRVERSRLDRFHKPREGWGDAGEYVSLTVRDTGEGMDEHTVARIFEPFFTGKEPGEGVGLGMAMVYGLMKQHRGFVDVRSTPGEGTVVKTFFPITKERTPRVESEAPRAPALAVEGSETILLVEDDEAIRRAARRILERFGYTVIVAVDGDEAVEMYREHQSEVDLVLCDVILPKRSGPEFYEAVRRIPGDPPVLFMSGYPARTVRARTALDSSLPFLQKPWTVDELAAAVRRTLDGEMAAASAGDPGGGEGAPTA